VTTLAVSLDSSEQPEIPIPKLVNMTPIIVTPISFFMRMLPFAWEPRRPVTSPEVQRLAAHAKPECKQATCQSEILGPVMISSLAGPFVGLFSILYLKFCILNLIGIIFAMSQGQVNLPRR